ncbi:hypothetical protein F0562_016324 [Nyssa sinensis]|uniref:protein-serine/threonine phosphatase n=1 Tax=Nyssa sinensis TaxID=561372 RepID=A0A5J4ZN40_9ASTE|nr:hypothetical protein F0562_016324 [Nyssa sinensis]
MRAWATPSATSDQTRLASLPPRSIPTTLLRRRLRQFPVPPSAPTHPHLFLQCRSISVLTTMFSIKHRLSRAPILLRPFLCNQFHGIQFNRFVRAQFPDIPGVVPASGPIERGFLSGPIERSFISCPLESQYDKFQRDKPKTKKWDLFRTFKKAIGKSIVVPVRGAKELDWANGLEKNNERVTVSSNNSSEVSLADDDDCSFESQNLQWAQGKAGEDRVHIVISEEHGWVFVGIYDGFNGPDATDFLLNNLYSNVQKELKGLLWNEKFESSANSGATEPGLASVQNDDFQQENYPYGNGGLSSDCDFERKGQKNSNSRSRGAGKKREESRWRWKCEWDRERVELDRKLKEQLNNSSSDGTVGVSHSEVLKALSEALRKTEQSYLEIADLMLRENPELSMMGSCVLGMLMKGEDVYLMNVGDSRAVLARKVEPDFRIGKVRQDLERISEETLNDLEFDSFPSLTSFQLTMDHSTSVEEEVRRIKSEHRDDASAVTNERVKGSLKVTRAFGAGFLKQPKWNHALLEMFRIDYIGTLPYINCFPSLYHHRLGPRDRFLILSSDGLYQYFTNQEAISEVETFIALFPEGDPAQHLVEEVLFRAAKKAGMDFHELLDIPQGDRRRYHDDVSIMIISFEGRIWRSFV